MANLANLRGALASLRSTLYYGLDLNFPDSVYRRWRQVLDHGFMIDRNPAWAGLPEEDGRYAPIVAALVAATHLLELSDEDAEILAALGSADHALQDIEALL